MAENSKIEWTHHTFNPWFGCTKVSEGCAHCYAEQSSPAKVARSKGHETWGKGAQRSRTSAANWKEPLRWNRDAAAAWENWTAAVSAAAGYSGPMPERPRVFCASLADWLDDEVPIEWLADLLELIVRTPHLDWLLLTKRPQNWAGRILEVEKMARQSYCREPRTTPEFAWKDCDAFYEWITDWTTGNDIPSNVWIGTTAENQARADERIPQLLSIPAKVRFLSCEPLLSSVKLLHPDFGMPSANGGIHWVICGGESGPKARPMHPDWARSLRDQCSAAGVPFFFKQWGEYWPEEPADGRSPEVQHARLWRVGKKKAGRVLDGRTHDEFPQVERIPAA